MTGGRGRLRIEPVVSRPRVAYRGRVYLVTVDLRGGGDGTQWPYDEEEFTFGIALDGHPHFTCEALGHPSVVLHRFGDTYGPARFVVTVGPAAGSGALRLTVSNGWGVPVRTATLPIEVAEGEPPPDDPAGGTGAEEPPVQVPVPGAGPEAPPEGGQDVEQARGLRPGGHLTVSFAGHNRVWASWIAGRLERRGVRVVLQRWDVAAGGPLADGLRDLLLSEGLVLLVLSDWYFRPGVRTEEEWNTALREVVAPHQDRFAAITVAPDGFPAEVAAVLDPAGLWDLDDGEAETRLLHRLGVDPADLPPVEPADLPFVEAADDPRFPLELPRVWGGVPRRNPRFTGREELLDDLDERFRQAEPGAGVVTLFGLSGVGKTHIATEYVYRFGAQYDVIWWVRAAERGTLREKLAGLAPALGLVTGRAYGERLRAIGDALRRGEPYRRWLVVLDGADRPDDIHDLVPNGPGHVLITSQNREWGEHNSTLIEVPVHSRSESVALVRRRAPRVDETDADRLAEALGDLALALDQSAGALADSTIPVGEYVGLLRQGSDSEPDLRVSADFQMTYFTAFAILLNRLREDLPEAVDLLRLCAFFGDAPVPTAFLRQDPAVGPARVWRAALGRLVQWSVVQQDPDEGERLLVHPLVQRAARADVDAADRPALAARVHRALVAVDPHAPDDTRTWPVYADIVPHLAAPELLASPDSEVQALVLDCLRCLYLAGDYPSGLDLSRRALRAWEAAGPGGHPRIWDLVHHHANLLRLTGDYPATEVADRAAWTRLSGERGPDHPDTLRAAAGLAADLRGLARYREAEQLSAEIVTALSRLHGPRAPRTLIAVANQAVSLRLLGHYGAALELDRETLDVRRGLLGPDSHRTLLSEVAVAEDLRLLGRHTEALELQEASYAVHRAVLGPDHPQSLRAAQNLALCRAAAGDHAAARAALARLLERTERVLDPAHPGIAIGLAVYAAQEREHGDLDRARALGERVLADYRERLGPDHPFSAGVLGNHALVLRAAGEQVAAAQFAAEALRTMTVAVGAAHPWTLGCALNAAEPGERARLAERAGAALGRDHPLTRACATGRGWDFEPMPT